MRLRIFSEIELTDQSVIYFKEHVKKFAPDRVNEPIDMLIADSLTRQIEGIVKGFEGVTRIRSVLIPTLLDVL